MNLALKTSLGKPMTLTREILRLLNEMHFDFERFVFGLIAFIVEYTHSSTKDARECERDNGTNPERWLGGCKEVGSKGAVRDL